MMKKLVVLMILAFCCGQLNAQTYYAVMVQDSKTAGPVVGATIKIKSTGEILTTSQSGNVVVLASPDDSLHIQNKGYKDRAISLVNQSQAISIIMTPLPKVAASKPKKKKH
ncbi:MAG: hypothetical protein JNM14_06685 [Ferruginibacter sp.]|nr:hypothetical protein [Ferruginibacter sp.]